MVIQLCEAGIADWPSQMAMRWSEWYDIYRRWGDMVEERNREIRRQSARRRA